MGDLSLHFSRKEFLCKCGHCDTSKQWVPLSILSILEMLHTNLSYEYSSKIIIVINSSWRCPSHNKEVGGSTLSKHLYGSAVDIVCRALIDTEYVQITPQIVGMHVDEIFPRKLGIGVYETFTHIDNRETRARW